MFYDNDNTCSYDNNCDNTSYDNTYDYDNTRYNIPYNNALFYDAYKNFLDDNIHESLPPAYNNNTYYENLSYDICLPYDTLENLTYNIYLPYDTFKNFSHNIILDYDVTYENLHKNLFDYDKDQYNQNADTSAFLQQDYEKSDDRDELVELTDSLELISGLTFNRWDEFKSWIDRFALKEGFNYKIRSSEKIEGVIQKVTYKCIKSGSNTSQVTSDPTKRRNASSDKTLCP
ncbi:hypothetical protein RclHR1_23080003 [Rhizophagus clarus]|uniref:FAR1 domain-containing protein n=1 Tax=Rhizophagus clarus TaxID=94130 RepID=A0A2Z6R054_9GLOM|nr:hypothetical protein RclHR1_23080003 [Rhizophagus clarus]GES74052.1 hypothetical protein GLOIN_2v1770853 [Rhizophagus clarus]